MQPAEDLASLPFSELTKRCQEQTTLYLKDRFSDSRYCFEIFRLALVDHSQKAWAALYQQYQPLVISWIQRSPQLNNLEESIEALSNECFAKFWAAMSPEKFAAASGIGSLLDYLRLCTGSVIVDHGRRSRRKRNQELNPELPDRGSEREIELLDTQELVIQIEQRLKDEDEKRVFFAMFTLGMKPREISDQWPEQFPTVQRVNQIRQNIVDRLRRDESLQRYYGM
ncbi:MAG: sigma-70 family RNA polymerase sigma factor [Caldilineaceae bacterium]